MDAELWNTDVELLHYGKQIDACDYVDSTESMRLRQHTALVAVKHDAQARTQHIASRATKTSGRRWLLDIASSGQARGACAGQMRLKHPIF